MRSLHIVAAMMVLLAALILPARAAFQVAAELQGVESCSVAWGDYDNDGDLDLALTGDTDGHGEMISRIYRNDSGTFTDISAGLPSVAYSSLAWGDYDNDGDLDLALTGGASGFLASRIYRNDSGAFTDIAAGLEGVYLSSIAWGDYDNDGDLDIALAGNNGGGSITKIYRNDNGMFTDISASLANVLLCSLAWGDYDNDGDLDLAVAGTANDTNVSKIYRNDNGAFSDIGAGLVGVRVCSIAWGDYDNDGDLDIALAGNRALSGSAYVSKIYRNDSGTFTDIGAALPGIYAGNLAWGDYDNDGDLDIALAGYTGSTYISKIYRNDSGTFSDSGVVLPGVQFCSLAWGDYDGDGDLDLALAGLTDSGRICRIYRSSGVSLNGAPSAPTGLSAAPSGDDIMFSWAAATDAQTPSQGLSYNLRVGTSPGDDNIFCGMANLSTGLRRVPATGNAQKMLSWTIKGLPAQAYYWSVQAIDTAFAGSAWASEQRIDTHWSEIDAGLTGVFDCSLAWGDYDNDGDLDLALAGSTSNVGGTALTKIYRNDSGTFTDIGAVLTGVYRCSLAWGDYDSDGDLDLALAGYTGVGTTSVSKIYRNDSGTFVNIGAALTGVESCSLAWGDYDNDGDLDLAIAGSAGSMRLSRIYRNDSGVFTNIAADLIGVYHCSLAWGDYDNDGDLDLALGGFTGGTYISKIYRNNSGAFYDSGETLPGLYDCSLAWGDYDNDGDLDLALAGYDPGSGQISKIYRNDSGAFMDSGASLVGVEGCSLAWGDYDNDGDLDLALAGYRTGTGYVSKIYRNDSGIFTDTASILAAVRYSSVAWGDYDNDGDLDLALAGMYYDTTYRYFSKIYRNDGGVFNTAPTAPTGLYAVKDSTTITFNWSGASDAETPSGGLSYNIRVGTSPGSANVFSGMANLFSGYRKIPATGNAQKKLSWTLKGLPQAIYYWSVQAIDTVFAGSAWAGEQSMSLDAIAPVIHSVTATPALVAPADLVNVQVNVTDNVGVSTVTANEQPLTKGAGDVWSGNLAAGVLGSYVVTVVAADASANTATDTSGDYRVGRIVGVNGRGSDQMMTAACENYLFMCWGKAAIINENSFSIDDGSGVLITVLAQGYSQSIDGHVVCVRGKLDSSGTPPTLTSTAGLVRPLN